MWHVNQNMCRLTCYLRTPFLALCLLTCLAIFDFASCQNITDLKSANYESRSRVESWVSSLTCSEVSFDKQAYQEEFAQIKPSPAVFVPLSRYLVSPCPRRPSEHPETNEYYQSLESPPTLAVGVLSAAKNTAHRMAMRKTWLSELGPRAVVKFFVAANDPGELDLSLPRSLLLECLTFNDILLVPGLKESYFSTPYKALSIFHWGEKIVGGYYTLRVNDDVYLDAKSLEEELAKVVPSRVYGLLLIPGDSMRIPRPSHHGLPDDRESQITLLDSHRAWTFLPSDYPSSAVPNFCQGNAVLLSNDLSSSLTSTNRPFSYYIPDDIMIALAVDFKTAGNFRQFSPFSVAYAHEGSWVKCSEGSGGWYNIHPEYMYLLWENRHGDWCSGIDEIMCCAIN